MTSPLTYTVPGTAREIGCGEKKVRAEIKAGRLIARKVRGRTIILPTDAKNYLRSLPIVKATPPEPAVA